MYIQITKKVGKNIFTDTKQHRYTPFQYIPLYHSLAISPTCQRNFLVTVKINKRRKKVENKQKACRKKGQLLVVAAAVDVAAVFIAFSCRGSRSTEFYVFIN